MISKKKMEIAYRAITFLFIFIFLLFFLIKRDYYFFPIVCVLGLVIFRKKLQRNKRFRRPYLRLISEIVIGIVFYHVILLIVIFSFLVLVSYDPEFSIDEVNDGIYGNYLYKKMIYPCLNKPDSCVNGACFVFTRDCFLSDDEYFIEDTNAERILFLGDSFTWGQGVDMSKNYVSVVRDLFGESNVEVMNLGGVGNNVEMEITRLQEIGLKYSPDTVVVQIYKNDYYDEFWSQYNLFNLYVMFYRLSIFMDENHIGFIDNFFYDDLYRGWVDPHFFDYYERNPEFVLNKVLVDPFETLDQLSKKYSFNVVILSFPVGDDIKNVIAEITDKYNWEHIDLEKELEYSYDKPELVQSSKDNHPSEYAHKIVGNQIYSILTQNSA